MIWSFLYGSQRESVDLVTHAAPARCAEMLARKEVDAALVPVIEYQRIAEVEIVPGVCVGSHDRVRSVVLASKSARLEEVKSVVLDESSRTSQALVKILFKEFFGFEPAWRVCGPNVEEMLDRNDAALVIGDPAMAITGEDVKVFDLASIWHEHTNTGFVFAMWMASVGAEIRAADFVRARDEGLANVERIVIEDEGVPLSITEKREYLTRNISFSLDASLEAGMRLFFELATKHRLIEENRRLRFLRT